MMKCAACGHDNVDGTTFCEMCGEDLQSTNSASGGDAAAPAADTNVGGDIKCPACENMNPPENLVCEVCGTELRGLDEEDEEDVAAAPVGGDTGGDTPLAGTGSSGDTPAVVTPPDADPAGDTSIPAAASTPNSADTSTVDTTTVDSSAATTGTPDPATSPAPDSSGAPAVALKPGMLKLVVEQGMTVGKQFTLGDAELQVGREDEDEDIYPDIDLADQDEGYVHRQHATLKFENDQLLVTHLGGANKTRLNNRPIPDNEPQPVKVGDKIAFGKVVMRVLPL